MFSALLYRNLVSKGNTCCSIQDPSIKIEESYKGVGRGKSTELLEAHQKVINSARLIL